MTAHYPNIPDVRFKDIDGFPGYCVGDDGSVWSRRRSPATLPEYRWRCLKSWASKSGHLAYGIYCDGRMVHKFGHQLVLQAFIGPCPDGMECCHNDGDPANNRLGNLRWDTRRANAEDCARHGRRPRGSGHGRAKVSEADIEDICFRVHRGESKVSVGRRYGISAQQVRRIVDGLQWKHVSWATNQGRPKERNGNAGTQSSCR